MSNSKLLNSSFYAKSILLSLTGKLLHSRMNVRSSSYKNLVALIAEEPFMSTSTLSHLKFK